MNVNIRTPLTLVILISVLIVGLIIGWRMATDDVPSLRESTASSSEPSCHMEELDAGSTLKAGQVTVNILNSGSTPNLAGDTMRALTKQGFEGGVTGNAPEGVRADGVLIIDPDPDSSQVRLITKQFAKRPDVKKSSEGDPAAVDIIVGNEFKVSSGIDKSAATSLKVKGTTEVCVPEPPDADD
ncbi:MAG TPA: LytR C-terminal domain-containing protein [Nocardioidaceae bacterium]|nr:LytR C-terminal domain-containing protein [Nocardioidaceae bacterium]